MNKGELTVQGNYEGCLSCHPTLILAVAWGKSLNLYN